LALDTVKRAALVRLCTKILNPKPGIIKLKLKTYPYNYYSVKEIFKVIMYVKIKDLFFKV